MRLGKWFIVSLALALAGLCRPVSGDDAEMSVTGLRVARGRWSPDDGGWLRAKETAITMRLVRREQDIVGLDLEKSELKYFTDDKGTDLLAGGGPSEGGKGLDVQGGYATNYHAYINIKAPSLPHPDATRLLAEGKLVLRLGRNKTEVENRGVEVKVGSEINCGPAMLKITMAKAPDIKKFPWIQGGNAVQIRIEGENMENADGYLRFTDEDGNGVSASRVGLTTGGQGGGSISMEYVLFNVAGKMTVTASYWAEVREVEIPFKIDMGIGMEEGSDE